MSRIDKLADKILETVDKSKCEYGEILGALEMAKAEIINDNLNEEYDEQ